MNDIYNNQANIYLLKFNNRNTRTSRKMYSKLTVKTAEWCHWRRSDVFIVSFEYLSHPVSIANFEHAIAGWIIIYQYHEYYLYYLYVVAFSLRNIL